MWNMCSESHLHFDYVRLAWDSGFCFQESKTKSAFDLSTIGLVDLEKLTRDRDIATVEKHIPTLLQFPLDEELTKILEPTFVKVFKLCQLALQYLIFCNKYLDNTVVILKKDFSASREDNINLQKLADQLKIENDNLRMKNKDLKETFQTINQSVSFKCQECPKVFYSEEYLEAHVNRRHDSQSAQLQSESEKLQLEIKELKERLNSTEKYVHKEEISEKDVDQEPNNDAVLGNAEVLQAKFDQLKEHIEKELSLLRDEAFYRNIYDKWFGEVFQKLKHESSEKVFVEQGSGDCVRVTESSTQTYTNELDADTEVTPIAPQPMPRKIHGETSQSNFEEFEEKIKHSADAQREILEKVLEQKLAGSIERLETQMNSFWDKMSNLETKKQERYAQIEAKNIIARPIIGELTKVAQTLPHHKFITPKTPVRITSSDTESNSESELLVKRPQPAQRIAKVVTTRQSTSKPPITVVPLNRKTIKQDEKRDELPFDESYDDTLSDESIEINAIKTDTSLLQKPKQNLVKVASRNNPIETRMKQQQPKKENKISLSKPPIAKKFAEQSSESSEESSKEYLNTKIKQLKSSRTSTLSKRSVTSIKKATLDSEVIEGTKNELEGILDLRLKEIGVAPQWKGLPLKTYEHAFSIIEHQASLSKKSILNYSKIRGEIQKLISKNLQTGNQNYKQHKISKSKTGKPGTNATGEAINIKHTDESFKESSPDNAATVKAFQNVSDLSSSESKLATKQEEARTQVLRENIKNVDASNKSDVKSNPLITSRKKVLFNLDSDESMHELKVQNEAVELSSSNSNSLLDEKKPELPEKGQKGDKENNKANDGSDWDISDIVA